MVTEMIPKTGYTLIMVLLVNLLLSLIILSGMQTLFLYGKMSNQVLISHQQFYQLESVASILVERSAEANISSNCIVNAEESAHLRGGLFLHQRGCSIVVNRQRYHYVLMDLGLYPCLSILSRDTLYSSHHWLINVVMAGKLQQSLQLRLALPEKKIDCMLPIQHIINAGVISWRSIVE